MIRLLILGVLLLLAPASAWAEACIFSTSGNYSSATAFSGTDDCTLSADDTITIPTGVAVVMTGDVTQSGSASITVQSGGSFSITGGSTKLDLTLGSGGLVCEAGSTCNLNGAYLTLGTSPGFVTEPSSDTYWQFGDYGTPQTCAGTSCALARISYPAAKYDSATGALDVGLDTSINLIAAGDIIEFFNPTGSRLFGTPDIFAHYQIAAASASTPYSIDFDVFVAKNEPIPNEGQEIVGTAATTGTTSAAALKGTRTVTVPAGTFSSTTAEYATGRWFRFESGTSGTYEPFGYQIMRVTDGGGGADTVEITDLRGFQYDYATASDFAIDYGWRTGDPFLIYRPVRILCATDFSCGVYLDGTIDVSAVHFEQIRDIRFTGNATISAWEDVYIQGVNDAAGTASLGVVLDGVNGGTVSMNRTWMIGDDAAAGAAGTTTHGWAQSSGITAGNYFRLNLSDSGTRFIGDDVIATQGTGTNYANLDGFRAQWMAENADSANLFDGSGGTSTLIVTGSRVECISCTGDDTSGESLIALGTSGSVNISDFLALGVYGSIHQTSITESLSMLSDFMVLGGNPAQNNGSFPSMRRFVIRGIDMPASYNIYNSSIGLDALNWQDGLIYNTNVTTTTSMVQISNASTPASTVRNVAACDNTNTGSTPIVWRFAEVAAGSVFSNLTVCQTPNFTSASGYQRGFSFEDQTSPTYTVKGGLVTGMTRASTTAIQIAASGAWTGLTDATDWCIFGNTGNFTTLTEAQFAAAPGGGSQIGRPPGLLDPLRYAVGAQSGSLASGYGCGANTRAGITDYLWIHAISGLAPENLGTLGGGGGGGGWLPSTF